MGSPKRPVQWSVEMEVLVLATLGFSDRFITRKTGLPRWRISVIVREYGVYRRQYRDCTSAAAKLMLANERAVVERAVDKRLKK